MTLTEQLDKIKEQEWFQQLKSSYDQLPPEQQNYVRWGTTALGVFLSVYLTWGAILSANSAKDEYFQKQELVTLLNQASDEMKRLKGQNSGFSQGAAQSWKAVFAGLAGQAALGADAVEVTKETPGATLSVIQETLLEVNVKNAPLRQLVQFTYQIEHGNPPMKLKGLSVQGGSPDGLLSATLNISGYLPKPEKAEKSK